MEPVETQEQLAALKAQLDQARERLDARLQDLRAVDSELEGMAKERHQYSLLEGVCTGLEQLGDLGAAGLFWGEGFEKSAREEHLRGVRGRLDLFQGRIGEIEERRQAVVARVRQEQDDTEILEDELLEIQRREEERKLEWVIEREDAVIPMRAVVMPWARGGEDDRLLRKALAIALLLCLLFGSVFPLIDLPLPEPWQAEEVPERLARLIREERPLPPPPPVAREEKLPDETKPVEETKPADKTTPKPAESKGILAFRERFSGLAEVRSNAKLGADARIKTSGESASGRPGRSMVTTQAPGSSGGINLAALSRDVGGGGDSLEGVQVVRATSSIGGIVGEDRPLADGASAGRTDEEIQIVFDRHKAALYRLYNRELRRDPTLKGQMVLRIRIEPDGSVTLCELHGSDMNAPELASQVLARVRTFDFGAKDGIPPITILYPIDFLPAT